jgi:hypothetical protein
MSDPTKPPTVDLRTRFEEPDPITEAELQEMEALFCLGPQPDALGFNGGPAPVHMSDYLRAVEVVPRLLAELRRLRSLFTEADAGYLDNLADECQVEYGWQSDEPILRDLAARLRSLQGEQPEP